MYIINKSILNLLEKEIFSILYEKIRLSNKLTIIEAAEVCNCSPSKISKFVHKLGFKNYKEYSDFINGKNFTIIPNEKDRIKIFLDNFNPQVVENFIKYFQKFDKLILFGYGPSFIISQYFEYKLRIISPIPVWAVTDEASVINLLTKQSLIIIFSITGQFKSFKPLYDDVLFKGGNIAFILEECPTDFIGMYDFIIILSKYIQNSNLAPHEKTRTTFFIFIEAIIKQLNLHKSEVNL